MTTNPALDGLQPLVGDWRMEIHNAAFLATPDARAEGPVEVAWLEQGAALVVRQGKVTSPPAAVWIIGRDENEPHYSAFYADDRGVSRVYQMTLEGPQWTMWRETPGFTQRFTAQFDPDMQTIRGQWEKSIDRGRSWEHDFDIDYVRVPSQAG